MDARAFVDFLNAIEKLKCNTRHSFTSSGRQESVAEHSWRLGVMAMLCADEYPGLDMNKVIKMCLIHDIGEAVTGDVPSFRKTQAHEQEEEQAIRKLLAPLPAVVQEEMSLLFAEMKAKETNEARLFKALDNMEAVISHNEADISTWISIEFEENLIYGQENCAWSSWTRELRELLKQDTAEKIQRQALR